jgi:uncharacterized RDD family membrane protein YckC
MNIFKTEENQKYAGTSRRGTAAMIDIWIVLFLRIAVMQLMGILWINRQLVSFMEEFKATFGTEEVKNVPEHLNFVINHPIFLSALFFYFITIMVGAIYHAYLNSSKWHGTIGKRAMKIMIVTQSEVPISFKRGMLHYFLSVMPFVYMTYIMMYHLRNEVSLSHAIMGSEVNMILGVIFILWIQIQVFSKRKTTAYDLICNTIFVNGRTNNKWPWSK